MDSSALPAEDRLRQAAEFIRTGKPDEARALLREILIGDRNNLTAWELLFHTARNNEESAFCLRAILTLRPDHPWARAKLAEINPQLVPASPGTAPLRASPSPIRGTPEKPEGKKSTRVMLEIGVVLASLVCLSVVVLAVERAGVLSRTSPADQTATALAAHDSSCQSLIQQAVQASGNSCQQIGPNKVCYGNDILKAVLIPSSPERFAQRGDVVDISLLTSLSASPLVLDQHQWGIAVFKVLANLPHSLPGETVTLLVFGNTMLDKGSGGLEAFHFSSQFGQIVCNKVNLDGIMVRVPKGQGLRFTVNGAQLTLMGDASFKASKNGKMEISMYSGAGQIVSQGREQTFGAGQKVSVGLGGPDGSDAVSPPSTPEPLSPDELAVACSLGGQYCSQSEITPVSPTDAQAMINSGLATSTPTGVNTSAPTSMIASLPGTQTQTGTPAPTGTIASTGTPPMTPTQAPARTPTAGVVASATMTIFSATSTSTAVPPTATFTPLPPTASSTPLPPTSTSTPIPPTATSSPQPPTSTPDCAQITLGALSHSGHNLTLTITNHSGAAVTITSLHITWNTGNAVELDSVALNGSQIGSPADTSSPTLLPENYPFTGSASARQIANGSAATLTVTFASPPNGTGYTVQLAFDLGCGPISASR
jgi:hypothetical protein